MEVKLAKRMSKIKPSPTLAITAKAKAMKAQGVDVVGFGAGEPDFDTPEHIKQAAVEALKEGFTKYTPVPGIDELRQAVAEQLYKDYGLEYSKDEIIISCGAKHSLYNVAMVLYEPSDEVIIPAPYWVTYPDQVNLAEATPVIVNTYIENEFKLTPEQLKESITALAKQRLLFLIIPIILLGLHTPKRNLRL